MVNLNHSLTIQIQGDSSDFSRELDRVMSRITDLESRMSGLESAGRRLGSSLDSIGNAVQPINRVSQALEKVRQQLTVLSQTPVILNVQPALAALQMLQAQIAATRAQLQSLQMTGSMGGGYGAGAYGAAGFAHGGLVRGRPGLDRIPARLSAGEFVVRETSVNQLGVQFLSALNEHGSLPRDRTATRRSQFLPTETEPQMASNQTHFGGVNIHVRQATDLPSIIRELHAGGIRLRNRRG
jgi:hypothetical protein